MSDKYYLYARKSTDVEDKQVLSIEAQLVELREFAKREDLSIATEFIEKKSAKTTGRPVFGKLLTEIESRGGNILAWHPDRLARNSVDGGQIVYLLDSGKLGTLKFPSFWFENTSQGKFMLSIAFGQSKYYVDNLSENTKRGLRQKVRRGERPGLAPVGYINDVRTKTVVVDKRRSPSVVEAFELYAKGASRLEDIAIFLASKGILTKCEKQFPKDKIKRMLTNPFYYGHFRYFGEIHEGKHKAIISKKLFNQVQATLARRGKPQKGKTEPQIFCGLLRCGSCNMAVTAEHKIKQQKNGNVHEYIYYRCTKKRKDIKCTEPAVTEKELTEQLTEVLHSYTMPKSWAEQLETMLNEDKQRAEHSSGVFVLQAQTRLASLQGKLQRLLDSYLDQDVDQLTYRTKQAELMSEKKSLEGKIERILANAGHWIEPMQEWLETAVSICTINEKSEHSEIARAFRQIEGLNLKMKNEKVVAERDTKSHSPQKNSRLALRAAREKTARMGGNFRNSAILMPIRLLLLNLMCYRDCISY